MARAQATTAGSAGALPVRILGVTAAARNLSITCFAAVRSYRLIFNNLLRFGATNSITAILMILGKVMVCLFSCLFGYTWVNYSAEYTDRTKDTYVTSSLFISICILMLAYLVAEAFFNLFHVAIDSILLCYCMVSAQVLLCGLVFCFS